MARITADSELMTNYISAVPVPAGRYFKVVLDEERRPMVIRISSDQIPKLELGEIMKSFKAIQLLQGHG
jgi:hypothetical protein